MHSTEVMAEKKRQLDRAAKAASSSVAVALAITEEYVSSSVEDRAVIGNDVEGMFPSRIRSSEIYSKLMWFTVKVILFLSYSFTVQP